jgi:cell division protein FtsQ
MDLRGLVRMGERRWDLVLADGKRILLPEGGAVRALERVIVLNSAQDMLGRDLALVDMRIAARPTIRLNENAMEDWWTITQMSLGTN